MEVLLSVLLGLMLGLVASGGSMLAVPVFRYGLGESKAVAFPGALLVVGIASLVSLVLYARDKRVRWAEGSLFAFISMLGAFVGGWVSAFIPELLHMILFAAVLLWTGWRLIKARGLLRERGEEPTEEIDQKRLIVTALALGALTGFLAIGGGVLVVSALILFMRMPVREAIATSLLVLSVNSFAGLAGHLSHVDLPWSDLIWIASLAAIGAVIGVFMNRRIPVQWLKDVLGYLVMGVAFLILYREFIW